VAVAWGDEAQMLKREHQYFHITEDIMVGYTPDSGGGGDPSLFYVPAV
jgi:hypothetical protein